jgi:hypothetical protein
MPKNQSETLLKGAWNKSEGFFDPYSISSRNGSVFTGHEFKADALKAKLQCNKSNNIMRRNLKESEMSSVPAI